MPYYNIYIIDYIDLTGATWLLGSSGDGAAEKCACFSPLAVGTAGGERGGGLGARGPKSVATRAPCGVSIRFEHPK